MREVAAGSGELLVMVNGESDPLASVLNCEPGAVNGVLSPPTYAFTFVIGSVPSSFQAIFALASAKGTLLVTLNRPTLSPGDTGIIVPEPEPGGTLGAIRSSFPLIDSLPFGGCCKGFNCEDPELIVNVSDPDEIEVLNVRIG